MIIQCETDSETNECEKCYKTITSKYFYKIILNDECNCRYCYFVNEYSLKLTEYTTFCSYECAKKFIRKKSLQSIETIITHTNNVIKYTDSYDFKK